MKQFFDFDFDPTAGVLRDAEGAVRLRPKTYALLEALVNAAPAVVGKDELLDRVWGREHLGETSLAQAISELRRVLGDEAKSPRFIETVHRRGYRFVAPIAEVASDGEALPRGSSEGHRSQPEGAGTPGAPTRSKGRLAMLALGLGGLLLVGVLLGLQGPRRAEGVASGAVGGEVVPTPVVRLAVLTVGEEGGSPEVPATWLEVLPSLLAPSLLRHSEIYVYSDARLRSMERDLGPLEPDSTPSRLRRLRYLHADFLLIGTVTTHGGDPDASTVALELVDGTGASIPLTPALVVEPSELETTLASWQKLVIRAVGLVPEPHSRAPGSLDWETYEQYVVAKGQRWSRPARALELLEPLHQEDLGPVQLGRLRAELHQALGEGEAARQVASQLRRSGRGLRRQVWYLNLADQPMAALALLHKRRVGAPLYAEAWLETILALEASGRPSDAEEALRSLARLPNGLASSWVGAELRLAEARLARRLGDPNRGRQASQAALDLAEAAGQVQVARSATSFLGRGFAEGAGSR